MLYVSLNFGVLAHASNHSRVGELYTVEHGLSVSPHRIIFNWALITRRDSLMAVSRTTPLLFMIAGFRPSSLRQGVESMFRALYMLT